MAKVSRRQTLGLGLGAGLSVTMLTGHDEAQAAPANVTFSLLLVNDIYKMSDDKGGAMSKSSSSSMSKDAMSKDKDAMSKDKMSKDKMSK